jgi:hypothetical protein
VGVLRFLQAGRCCFLGDLLTVEEGNFEVTDLVFKLVHKIRDGEEVHATLVPKGNEAILEELDRLDLLLVLENDGPFLVGGVEGKVDSYVGKLRVIVDLLDPLVAVLPPRLLQELLAGLPVDLLDEVEGLKEEVEILRENLDDVKDEFAEGGVVVALDAVDGRVYANFPIRHIDGHFKDLKSG